MRLPKSSSIITHLKSLHLLPVKARSTYKIACLCYHCHSSTTPSYVVDMLQQKPSHTRNTRSSSYTMPLHNKQAHSKTTLGDRSFSFASSFVWNYIPNDDRSDPSLSLFKFCLKTYFFCSAYKNYSKSYSLPITSTFLITINILHWVSMLATMSTMSFNNAIFLELIHPHITIDSFTSALPFGLQISAQEHV